VKELSSVDDNVTYTTSWLHFDHFPTMKNIVALSLLSVLGGPLTAQPVITGAEHLPMIGTSRQLYSASLSQEPPPGGANVVFDYSWLVSGGQVTMNYVVPSSTPNGALYPNSEVALAAASGEVRYLALGPEGLEEHGIDVTSCAFVWSDPLVFLPDQLTMSDYWIDTYNGSCDLGFVSIDEAGTYEITVDGWGTLLMPTNTFTDVLRVQAVKEYADVFSGVSTDWRQEIYEYYAPGIVEPVLSTVRLFQVVGGNSTQLTYNANFVVEAGMGAEEGQAVNRFDVYPDPVTDLLTITSANASRMEIVDAVGRTLLTTPLSGDRTVLDLTRLASGCYALRVFDKNGSLSMRQLVRE
jgi:Secretion system C-terminal sorting domain